MSLPQGWGDDALSKHMGFAISNAHATFASIKPQYESLACVDLIFLTICSSFENDNELLTMQALWPVAFMARAHSGYRAACQLAMSGQITESIPVLRTCFEYSLYALHISKHKTAMEVWSKQCYDNTSTSKQSISRVFTMRALKSTLEATDPKLLPHVDKLYQLTINFGGHPNPAAIASNLIPAKNNNEQHQINLALIHDDPQTIEIGMELAANVGLICLLIFEHIFPEPFKGLEINTTLDEIKQNLSSH